MIKPLYQGKTPGLDTAVFSPKGGRRVLHPLPLMWLDALIFAYLISSPLYPTVWGKHWIHVHVHTCSYYSGVFITV